MREKFNKYYSAIINFIFPLRCVVCDGLDNNRLLCIHCAQNINFITDPCKYCGYQLTGENELESNVCANCIRNPPNFSSLRSVMFYNDNSKSIVRKFKFNDGLHAAKFYSEWLVKLGHDLFSMIDIILPVPLHRFRLFSRGYNQSSLLANFISRETNIKVDHLSLFKKRNTKSQSQSSTVIKRLNNMNNVFAVKNSNNIKNQNILLVDDVVTTGATIHACSNVLLENGAKSVHAITIARTEKPLIRMN